MSFITLIGTQKEIKTNLKTKGENMRKVGLVLILLIAGAGIATAQFSQLPLDYNILGGGARAHGMGGAFIGLADDATATSWNPAGIAQLDKMEASAVGNFSSKKFTFETDVNDPAASYTNKDSYTQNTSHIAPNFFSLALPFKVSERNVVFAIAYQRLIDFGYDEKYDSTANPSFGYTWDYTVRGGIDAISPAIKHG
jgi:long-subunit fatty acid transport protein